MKKLFLAALFLFAFAVPAFAEDVPLFSMVRLSIAGGANYDWFSESNIPPHDEEFSVGLYGAYSLSAPPDGSRAPNVSLIGALERGFENRTMHAKLGLRVVLFDGGR